MTTAPGGGSSFRSDIEGLRGIAVLLVVLYHAHVPGFAGGFIGVDVFFVLSGYLITGLLAREVETTGRLGLMQFYARRARRLLPASAVVLVATLIGATLLLAPFELGGIAKAAVATALYVSNILFMRQTGDYFAADAETNPLLHTWSLAVEEQFYLVWPLFVLVMLRRSRRALVAAMVLLGVVSFAACVWMTLRNQPVAFYSSPLRAWEFAMGGLGALLPFRSALARSPAVHLLGWLALAAIVACGGLITDVRFPGAIAMLPVAATTLALMAGAHEPRRGHGRLLNLLPLQQLGRLSYAWYLWHWPVLVLAAAVTELTFPLRALCIIGSLMLAWLTHVLVENPVRFHPGLVRRPRLSLAGAAVLTLASATAGLLFHRTAARHAASDDHQQYTQAFYDEQKLARLDCVTEVRREAPRECVFGDEDAPTTVVLFGDSHAAQWFPALERAAQAQKWRLVTLVKFSCPAARVAVTHESLKREYTECTAWREAALKRIAELRPALVVMSGSRTSLVRRVDQGSSPAAAWQAGNEQTLSALAAAGTRTILLHDTPSFAYNVPVCLSRAARRGAGPESCSRPQDIALDPAVHGAEAAAANAVQGAAAVDFSDLICDAGRCDAMRDGLVVYRDAGHLTTAFAESLAAEMARRVTPHVRNPALTGTVSVAPQ